MLTRRAWIGSSVLAAAGCGRDKPESGWPAAWDRILIEKAASTEAPRFDEKEALVTRLFGPGYRYHTKLREGRVQQIGTPEQLHNNPANWHVADFMGYCDPEWTSDYTYLGIHERLLEVAQLPQITTRRAFFRHVEVAADGVTLQDLGLRSSQIGAH